MGNKEPHTQAFCLESFQIPYIDGGGRILQGNRIPDNLNPSGHRADRRQRASCQSISEACVPVSLRPSLEEVKPGREAA